jgi:PAS domain S-box-containing protein
MSIQDEQSANADKAYPIELSKNALTLLQRAEGVALREGDTSPLSLSAEEVRQTLHKLQVHQIELEMQADELRRAQTQLQIEHERYVDLYDLAPVGYCTLSERGLILQANLTMGTFLGVARGTLVRQPISKFIFTEDQDIFYLMRQDVMKIRELRWCELRMIRTDGTPLWIHLAARALADESTETRFHVVISDITERKHTELALRASLKEKGALLMEVHHRVKNNLQVITSLLRLESGRSDLPTTKAVLKAMQARIRSMALLHESLYRKGTFASIELGDYLRQVATQTFSALLTSPGAIHLRLELGAVQSGMDQAMPCGLLVTELLTNALNHGFPDGRLGEVCLELHSLDNDANWRLRVSDTGVGLPDDIETKRQNSLGLRLVTSLSNQCGGSLKIGPGPVFTVDFRVVPPAPLEMPALTNERPVLGSA